MEPLSHPIWKKRVRCLAGLLERPMTLPEIRDAASAAWGWSGWFTTQVVCAGEGGTLRARRVRGEWRYGRLPGTYAVASRDLGRELRRVVATTIKGQKAKPVRTW